MSALIRSFAALLALIVGAAAIALAQPRERAGGLWVGTYACAQGLTGVALLVRERAGGAVEAVFAFHEDPRNPGVPHGCYRMRGSFNAATGQIQLSGGDWIERPYRYIVADVDATIGGATLEGTLRTQEPNRCTFIVAERAARPAGTVPPTCFGIGPVAETSVRVIAGGF